MLKAKICCHFQNNKLNEKIYMRYPVSIKVFLTSHVDLIEIQKQISKVHLHCIVTEQKLRQMTSNLREGSVRKNKLFEMINPEFKAQGTNIKCSSSSFVKLIVEYFSVFNNLRFCGYPF